MSNQERSRGWHFAMPIVGAEAQKFEELLERSKLRAQELAARCFLLGLELLHKKEFRHGRKD